jgi:putative alpha-1,2-mannosidase
LWCGTYSGRSNEPSHHIPYLYALAGAASRTQSYVRNISAANYNSTPNGLSGVNYDFAALTSDVHVETSPIL